MTIKAKILCLVGAFALLAIVITGMGLNTMADYNRVIEDYRHTSDNVVRGERLNRYLMQAALDGHGIYSADSPHMEQWAANRVDLTANMLADFVNDWNAHLKPGELADFPAVRAYVLDMARDGHALAKIAREKGLAAANAYGDHPEYRASREQIQARIDTMIAGIDARQTQSQNALSRFESERTQQFLLTAAIGIFVLLIASLWIAVRAIAAPLSEVRRSMVKISEGQYETPIPPSPRGNEIGELWGALDILKTHAIEAERLARERLEAEHRTRELVLD